MTRTWFLNSKCGEHDMGMMRMPKSDPDRHSELLQDYRDLVARVNVVREVIELAFDVTLPSAPTTKEEFAIFTRAIYNTFNRIEATGWGHGLWVPSFSGTYPGVSAPPIPGRALI
jgi:hypothetical protein